jgi:hypothetical protein
MPAAAPPRRRTGTMRRPPPELREFLAPYDPAIARLFYAVRKAVLESAPQADEFVYDAYNAVAAAYSYTGRLKEAFCHIAAYRGWVNLGFNRGRRLPDPERLLQGTGASIRHVRIASPADLERAGVKRLIAAAAEEGRSLGPEELAKPVTVVKGSYPTKRRPTTG